MRRLIKVAAVAVLLSVGFYAWRLSRDAQAPHGVASPTVSPLVGAGTVAENPKNIKPLTRLPPNPYMGTPYRPEKKYPPGTYIPAGFDADFRQHVKMEFSHFAATRLGSDLDEKRMAQVAAVQDAFWDVHGPDSDLFMQGRISQPEFAERAHKNIIEMSTAMEKIFTDEEYLKIFDVPKSTDTFYVLAHSPDEQPGMRFKDDEMPAPNLSVIPQASPHASVGDVTASPHPSN
jgi:hypothetical protein